MPAPAPACCRAPRRAEHPRRAGTARRAPRTTTQTAAPEVLDPRIRCGPKIGFHGRPLPTQGGPLTGLETGSNGASGFPSLPTSDPCHPPMTPAPAHPPTGADCTSNCKPVGSRTSAATAPRSSPASRACDRSTATRSKPSARPISSSPTTRGPRTGATSIRSAAASWTGATGDRQSVRVRCQQTRAVPVVASRWRAACVARPGTGTCRPPSRRPASSPRGSSGTCRRHPRQAGRASSGAPLERLDIDGRALEWPVVEARDDHRTDVSFGTGRTASKHCAADR